MRPYSGTCSAVSPAPGRFTIRRSSSDRHTRRSLPRRTKEEEVSDAPLDGLPLLPGSAKV
jgi:hypothetical protein